MLHYSLHMQLPLAKSHILALFPYLVAISGSFMCENTFVSQVTPTIIIYCCRHFFRAFTWVQYLYGIYLRAVSIYLKAVFIWGNTKAQLLSRNATYSYQLETLLALSLEQHGVYVCREHQSHVARMVLDCRSGKCWGGRIFSPYVCCIETLFHSALIVVHSVAKWSYTTHFLAFFSVLWWGCVGWGWALWQ